MDKLLEISKIEVEAPERCTFMNVDNPVAKSGLTVSSAEIFRTAGYLHQEESVKQVLYLQVPMLRNLLRIVYLVNRAIIMQIAK